MTIPADASEPATDNVENTAMARFRLLRPVIENAVPVIDRLMAQVRRIKEINKLNTVTREVVDAARDCLVIGIA